MKRTVLTLGLASLILVSGAAPALAHGIGGRSDLPVPLTFFLAGGTVVLILSFAALSALWPEPRLQQAPALRRLNFPGFRLLTAALTILGVVGLVLVVATGLGGVNNSSSNPAPILLWVFFWLVIPFLAVFVGNLYRFVNPWTTLARWLKLGGEERIDFGMSRGMYAAAGLFFAFTWLELVYPDPSAPRIVAAAALTYTIIMFVSIDRLGAATTVESVDAFSAYNRMFAGISPVTTDPEGNPAWRGWLRGLPLLNELPGLTVFLVVMIGTVTFDGMSGTPWFSDVFGDFGGSVFGGTVLLVATVGFIGMGYGWASQVAARIAGDDWSARRVADRFAHSLVPIAFAYAFAHYFTLVVFEGQILLSTMSDPFGQGWDLFGTVDREIDFTLLTPTAVWWVQVFAIVGGHLAGVVLAHDRALADFPPDVAVKTQYAMLVLMVGLTGIGLSILAAG